jgi:hypothetical protein
MVDADERNEVRGSDEEPESAGGKRGREDAEKLEEKMEPKNPDKKRADGKIPKKTAGQKKQPVQKRRKKKK